MSRNLGHTDCDRCDGRVNLCGPAAPITREQSGPYFQVFAGLLVADAECEACGTPYLAWVDERGRRSYQSPLGLRAWTRSPEDGRPFFDLSYRSSFNDEPGVDDAPKRDPEGPEARARRFMRALLGLVVEHRVPWTRVDDVDFGLDPEHLLRVKGLDPDAGIWGHVYGPDGDVDVELKP